MSWAVRPTAHSIEQAAEIERWWKNNRPAAPGLFQAEISDMLVLLETAPEVSARVPSERFPELRRVLLPKTGVHVYFLTDAPTREVTIVAFWGARRGSAPDFGD